MRQQPARLVFVDETAVTTKMVRLHGRAWHGERLRASAPFGLWKTQTFIAGLYAATLSRRPGSSTRQWIGPPYLWVENEL